VNAKIGKERCGVACRSPWPAWLANGRGLFGGQCGGRKWQCSRAVRQLVVTKWTWCGAADVTGVACKADVPLYLPTYLCIYRSIHLSIVLSIWSMHSSILPFTLSRPLSTVGAFHACVVDEGLALAHSCDEVSRVCACVSCAYWSELGCMRGYQQHSHAASDARPVAFYHRLTPLFLPLLVNGTTALVNLLLVHGADVNATLWNGCGAHTQLMNPHARVTVWVGVRVCVYACVCTCGCRCVRACVSNKHNWAF
jgi:hypothetical protein